MSFTRFLAVSMVMGLLSIGPSFAAFVYPGLQTINSTILGRTVEYDLAMPQTYLTEPTKTYPILFALHGHAASYTSWTSMTRLVAALDTCPMVLCAFDGGDNRFVDVTEFFFEELVPEITTKYKGDGQYACTGFSMGGYGTWHFMLTQPDFFSSVSALSGAFYTDSYSLYPRMDSLHALGVSLPPAYTDCGTEDSWVVNNRQMRDSMNVLGYALEYHETAGAGHDWDFWSNASPALAHFHYDNFDYAGIAGHTPVAVPSLTVAPNPSAGVLRLEGYEAATVQLRSLDGDLVATLPVTGGGTDWKAYAGDVRGGLYLLTAADGTGAVTVMLVK